MRKKKFQVYPFGLLRQYHPLNFLIACRRPTQMGRPCSGMWDFRTFRTSKFVFLQVANNLICSGQTTNVMPLQQHEFNASQVPPEWHSWISHIRKDPPTEDALIQRSSPPWKAVSPASVMFFAKSDHSSFVFPIPSFSLTMKTWPELAEHTDLITPWLLKSTRGNPQSQIEQSVEIPRFRNIVIISRDNCICIRILWMLRCLFQNPSIWVSINEPLIRNSSIILPKPWLTVVSQLNT
jgi:hypothetical protein